jgi:hypothetical protein
MNGELARSGLCVIETRKEGEKKVRKEYIKRERHQTNQETMTKE